MVKKDYIKGIREGLRMAKEVVNKKMKISTIYGSSGDKWINGDSTLKEIEIKIKLPKEFYKMLKDNKKLIKELSK